MGGTMSGEGQYDEELRTRARRLRDRGFAPSNAEYWNRRYVEDVEPMEWYQQPQALEKVLNQYVRAGMKVLIVGCGNSTLGESMYDTGVVDITNIDFSDVVISQMEDKYAADRDGMKWAAMDAREMNKTVCPDETFDVVIDKACLDCNMSGPGSARNADRMLSEVSRVLKPLGVFISISFMKPDQRLPFLEKEDGFKWDVEKPVKTMTKPTINPTDIPDIRNPHFVYVITKKF